MTFRNQDDVQISVAHDWDSTTEAQRVLGLTVGSYGKTEGESLEGRTIGVKEMAPDLCLHPIHGSAKPGESVTLALR